MPFEWSENLSVNIAEIDEQHKRLIALLNNLEAATHGGKRPVPLSTLFDELLAYAAEHFNAEELLLERYRFPGLQAHCDEHVQFIRQVTGFKGMQEFEFYAQLLSMDLLTFLTQWLQNHIMKSDKLYASYFNEQGIHRPAACAHGPVRTDFKDGTQ